MKVEYSRQAMQALLALEAGPRRRAVRIVEQIASGTTEPAEEPDEDDADEGTSEAAPPTLSLVAGSEFELAPYSATGDLVLARKEGRLTVIALTDILGGLNEASEQ